MSAKTDGIIRSLRASILRANEEKTKPYDTRATIRRIEGQTAWVHINGGVDETPVRLTIGARVGDEVQVRVSGGTAFLVGNGTAPPTDDRKANEVSERLTVTNKILRTVKTVAERASRIATSTAQYFWVSTGGTDNGAHVTSIPQSEFEADPSNGGGNTLMTSNGVAVRDGLAELATFSADGAVFTDGTKQLAGIHPDSQGTVISLQGEYDVSNDEWDGSYHSAIYGKGYQSGSIHEQIGHLIAYAEDESDPTAIANANAYVSTYNASQAVFEARINALGRMANIWLANISSKTYLTTNADIVRVLTEAGVLRVEIDENGNLDLKSGTYKKGGSDFIAVESYDLGYPTYTAGSIGTVASVISKDVTKSGYTPISCDIDFISATTISLIPYFNSSKANVITQIVRRQTTAFTNTTNKATLYVTYMKN